MSKLLLHVCCAPCASACVERLLAETRNITLYYSNSNLASVEEYDMRLRHVRRLADHYKLPLLEDEYRHDRWLETVQKVDDYAIQPERGPRCHACFGYSFERTALKASELGMNFTTTLTVSPHKNSRAIFAIGERFSHFEAIDFKKKDGFKRSLELSAMFHFYRQSFCGCEFSLQK